MGQTWLGNTLDNEGHVIIWGGGVMLQQVGGTKISWGGDIECVIAFVGCCDNCIWFW